MVDSSQRLPVGEAGWDGEEVEANLERFHERRQRQLLRSRLSWVASGALAVAAALLLIFRLNSDPPAVDAAEVSQVEEGAADPLPGASRAIAFRDGSTAQLETANTALKVVSASDETIAVELSEGSAQFQVVPNRARKFVVSARGLTVTVLGTEFRVELERTRTRIEVARGKVQVDSTGGSRTLIAGEAAWFQVSSAYRLPAHKQPELEAHAGSAPSDAPTKPVVHSSESGLPPSSDLSRREKFIELHQRAEYMKAYQLLAKDRGVVGKSSQDLMRAADAARYSGHPGEAVGYLERVAARGDSLSTSASFTLGRLFLHELGQPSRSAQAFARARRLAGAGPLAEDALYREIEARKQAGEDSSVRSLAEKYVKTYPKSRRAKTVAGWARLP